MSTAVSPLQLRLSVKPPCIFALLIVAAAFLGCGGSSGGGSSSSSRDSSSSSSSALNSFTKGVAQGATCVAAGFEFVGYVNNPYDCESMCANKGYEGAWCAGQDTASCYCM